MSVLNGFENVPEYFLSVGLLIYASLFLKCQMKAGKITKVGIGMQIHCARTHVVEASI